MKVLESVPNEIISIRALKSNIYILNVYSSPIDRLGQFHKFFASVTSHAKKEPPIVAGDFNAHNTIRDCATSDWKRTVLTEHTDTPGLIFTIDSELPIRRRDSVERDNAGSHFTQEQERIVGQLTNIVRQQSLKLRN
ncbi:hypothetical protein HPB50_006998 [Hyalomma asiaticum]|uniref:Uncharacterized protein n=1 Tax=Hyalomma asiaticum TaxID=266040 RepID=A0ACB7S7L0_HYAAI|nr:hypothetical protein HPB50_006998 [Hyalomma asiaticum]